MEKRIVEGVEFTMLGDGEVKCDHEFGEEIYYEDILVNPNGEFVVGYGHGPVFVHAERKRQRAFCVKCGFDRNRLPLGDN